MCFNGVCKGYMTMWFAYHFQTFKIVTSPEFESVVLSLIPLEDLEGLKQVESTLAEIQQEIG